MGVLSTADLTRRKDEIFARLSELRTKDAESALSEDEDREVDALIAEANDIGPKIARARSLEQAERSHADAKKPQGSAARSLVQTPDNGEGGDDSPRDFRGALRQFFNGEEMEDLRARGGKGVASFDAGSLWDMRSVLGPDDQRALAQTGDMPDGYLAPYRIPGIQRGADLFGSLRDVLNVGVTNSDNIVFFRETSFTNNAGAVGEATATDGTTGIKPESELEFERDSAEVKTLAHWIPITRQLLWNAPEFESYVSGRLVDGLRMVENNQLLNGDGAGENLTGILNTSGIQYLDAEYWTASPVDGAGSDNEDMERILRARTLVATEGRARANFVVMNPADHEKFLATKDGQNRYFGQGPFSGAMIPTLWGLQVVENENIAEGNMLVGDGRQATIWDRMAAEVTTGTIDKQFIRNMLTILAEERVALTVFRPAAFAHVELVGA